MLSGTTGENLLKHATGNAGKPMRCHRCTATCTGEHVADDLLHVSKVRLMKSREEEDGWVYNLMSVDAGDDDLRDVRARAEVRDTGTAGEKGDRREKARDSRRQVKVSQKEVTRSRPEQKEEEDKEREDEAQKAPGLKEKRRQEGGKEGQGQWSSQSGRNFIEHAVRLRSSWMGAMPAEPL